MFGRLRRLRGAARRIAGRRALRWSLPVLLLPVLLVPVAGTAQETNRVGVVVAMGDGRIETACVSFSEPSISGLALLERSGLDLNVQASGGNASVCSIDGKGCSFPREGCFCQCKGGGPCRYWTYWHLNGAGWQYASTGAATYQVAPGSVEGWAWGDGSTGMRPPAASFDKVCPVPARTAPVRPSATLPRLAPNRPPATTPNGGTSRSRPSPTPVRRPSVRPAPASTPSPAIRYLLWGGTATGLLFAIVWVSRRRQ